MIKVKLKRSNAKTERFEEHIFEDNDALNSYKQRMARHWEVEVLSVEVYNESLCAPFKGLHKPWPPEKVEELHFALESIFKKP